MSELAILKIKKRTIEEGNDEEVLNEVKNYLSSLPDIIYEDLERKFLAFLESNNKLKTTERFKILEKIATEKYGFTVSSIRSKVLKDFPIDKTTVRRCFNLLIECNIIKEVEQKAIKSNSCFYYELVVD